MVTTSRELKVRYVGDDSALRRTISGIASANASLSSKLQNVGKSMFRTGRTITTGLTLPLVAMGKVANDEFTQLQKVNESTQAVLKSTGGAAHITVAQIHELSSSLGDLTAQDGEAVQETENLLLTFTRIRNEVGKGNDIFNQASKQVQNLSAGMGQSAKTSALQLGIALNDPIAGVGRLTRVGVTFDDQQKKAIARAMEHNDILSAQKIILAEVQKEFGGQAKALGDTASPMTRLNLAFRDFAEVIGAQLAPILEKVTGWLTKAFDWIQKLSPTTQKWIVIIGILAAALGPVILIVGALITAIGAILSPITLVILGVAALAFVIIKNWGAIKRVTLAVWGWMQKYIGPVVRVIVAVVGAYLRIMWAEVKFIFHAIKTVVLFVWNTLKTEARIIWAVIKAVIVNPVLVIKDKVVGAFRAVRDGVVGAWNWIRDKVGVVIDWIASKIQWLVDKLHILINALPGIGGAAASAINNALDAANNAAPRTPPPNPGGKGRIVSPGGLGRITTAPRGGGVTYVVNVNAGTVTAERDLVETLRRELVKVGRRNGGRVGFD